MIERLLRVENLVVVPLLAVAVLVALGARWRNDPAHERAASGINRAVAVGLVLVVAGIAVVVAAAVFLGPIGP